MKKPLLTVITVTYNLIESKRENSFRQCVESVYNQTYGDIEHLVIDGASTDRSIELIDQYAQKGWIRYVSEPDKGVYDAMNKGIEMANGKYIAFLNSDDFWHDKNGIQQSIGMLENENADYSFSDTCVLNENMSKSKIWFGRLDNLPFAMHYCHQAMIVKVDVLKKIGLFDTRYRISADSDVCIKLVAHNAKSVYVPFCYTSYRMGGISSNADFCREEHSLALYKSFGKDSGLSYNDCYSIWQFRCLTELSPFECLRIANKMENKLWRDRLKHKINSNFIKYYRKKLFSILSN